MTFRTWLLILAFAAVGGLVFFAIPRFEGDPPIITGLEDGTLGRSPRKIEIRIEDADAGVRNVEVSVVSEAGAQTLVTRSFLGNPFEGGRVREDVIELDLDPDALELPDGPAMLTAVAHDWSLRGGFEGNRSEVNAALVVDTVAPRVSAESGLTYVDRGGSGTVVYRVDPDATRHGVRVADTFFPGRAGSGAVSAETGRAGDAAIAVFAVPVDAPPEPVIRIVASDEAGNERTAGFPVRVRDREFENRDLELSQSFLEQRAAPLASANGFETEDPVQAFRDVNEALRERSERRISEAIAGDPSAAMFEGVFEQMRGSQVTSGFAERRRYLLEGREISKATHFGFDLASTAGAKVTSANSGVVVLAEDLGIYGNCVIVDHGLGVHSLYGHLSAIDVAKGDRIGKGDVLGRSGMTGLAGGDHLHFAILVGGQYVDPMEWWDPKWVESHVAVRLAD